MASYVRPVDLGEALRCLASAKWTIVAGGTDYYPARVGRPLDDDVLDISGIGDFGDSRAITEEGDHWRIPALTTWSDLIAADLPPLFDGLKLAARDIGGVQIQNAGTVCGNLANASPAADGTPNLLAQDAMVELASQAGTRRLTVAAFVTGNRQTARRHDELVSAILVPKPAAPARATFLKLGARRYLVISIAMVAAVIEAAPDGTVAKAGVAIGACSAVAQRLPELERTLAGASLRPGLGERVRAAHLAGLSPLDDVRASAEYRREAALTLVRRALERLAGGAA